jgi:osmotically-inducible protein OsmY
MKSDSELQRDVLRELEWDEELREAEVGVAVDRGIVALSGTLTSCEKRKAALAAAHRVPGVLDVVNELRVQLPGTGRTNMDVARAVRDALHWDVLVPDAQLRSTVSFGEVLLEGQVSVAQQRADAERAVRNVAGVTGVINHIEVSEPLAVLVNQALRVR